MEKKIDYQCEEYLPSGDRCPNQVELHRRLYPHELDKGGLICEQCLQRRIDFMNEIGKLSSADAPVGQQNKEK